MKNGSPYSFRSVQRLVKRRGIGDQLEKDLELSVLERDTDRAKEVRENRENILKDLSMSRATSFFKESFLCQTSILLASISCLDSRPSMFLTLETSKR